MDGGLTAQQARGVDTIHESGLHLLALINDILDLARIEAGHTDLAPAPLKLPELLQSVVKLMKVKADEKRLALRFVAGQGLPDTVLADERRLRQVLLNLLGNAIKFTDAGAVTISAGADAPDGPEMLVRVDVEDTGVGMRAEDLDRIFKPFEQVGDMERRSGGTGLGLAITRALVHEMGGRILVSSELGRGSRFRVELPLQLAEPQAPATRKAPAIARYLGPARRVLVVDDVAANRALLCDVLAKAGFILAQAGDGEELLARARSFRPDLILVDSLMPALGGVEATRRLRREPDIGGVPVIAVSATASAEHRAACLDAGVNVFLAKPVSLEALLAAIGEQLQLQWAGSPAPG
jgi:CheY-like chemotaxis protein